MCLKANLGHVPPPFPSPQPSTSQRSLLLSPPGKEKSSAVTSNIIVDAEQVDTPDQAEQAQTMSTVVSEQDQQETQGAEEVIKNSEMQETVELAEKVSESFECPLCDFTSKWQNGLNVHMARKHSKLDQLDGASEIEEAIIHSPRVKQRFWD